jgi:hypothetical protein
VIPRTASGCCCSSSCRTLARRSTTSGGSPTLPDANDRHVLAAAIRSSAQTIVTFNLKDFPHDALDPFGIEARHPDDFVVDQIGLAPGLVVGALLEQVATLKNPPMTREQVLDRLRDCGLVQSVAKLRELLGRR